MDRPPHEEVPTEPTERRTATTFGCLVLIFILAGLVWFAVNHTQTNGEHNFLGLTAAPAGALASPVL